MRYFLGLEFDGTNYHGWQNQPNALSVQEVLEKALSTLIGAEISIVGAGRTDAGVHAELMYAHFNCDGIIDLKNLHFRLNAFLPYDIAIKSIEPVNNDAHARFDATSRSYIYRIHNRKDVFLKDRSYYLHQDLNLAKMNEAGEILLRYSDFECFSKNNTDVKTFICDIKSAIWLQNEHLLEFRITADRFLRNMVRAIVGTMINIGCGKVDLNDLHEIIKSKNRTNAGYSVPAHGLYLTDVSYPKTIYLNQ
ncbi:MAG: tRNA pseudouridine(38-40) synthase TruA [Bacteroidota bacterium]